MNKNSWIKMNINQNWWLIWINWYIDQDQLDISLNWSESDHQRIEIKKMHLEFDSKWILALKTSIRSELVNEFPGKNRSGFPIRSSSSIFLLICNRICRSRSIIPVTLSSNNHILCWQSHAMSIAPRNANNHGRCQQPHAMPASTGDANSHTRCQQPLAISATTRYANNHTRCQQPRTMPTTTHDVNNRSWY